MHEVGYKFYVNARTQKIHIVGKFPAPRGKGSTHCGHTVGKLVECTPSLAHVAPFGFCRRCVQLSGLEE